MSDATKDGAPVIFTANIGQSSGDLTALNQTPYLRSTEKPFGEKGGVVVLNGGSAFTVKKDTLTTNTFNSVGANNGVLYP